MEFDIELQGYEARSIAQHSEISDFDIKQANTKGAVNVVPKAGVGAKLDGSKVCVTLKPLSWNVIRVSLK